MSTNFVDTPLGSALAVRWSYVTVARAAGFDALIPSAVFHDAVILVVDDVAANVALLERLLLRAGVKQVVTTTDPRQAIDHYRTVEPDLILLDMHMPHLDGVAVLQTLAAITPPDSFVPAIVLTADSTDEAKQRALAAGAKDFVTKPFEQTEVLLRVKNLLETRSLHLNLQRHNAALQAELKENAERERAAAAELDGRLRRMQHILDHSDISMVFQPIFDLASSQMVGVEALARFSATPNQTPDKWFAEAASLGLGADLEMLAVRAAVSQIDALAPGAYMAVNVSPSTAIESALARVVAAGGHRIVVELTEHAAVEEYDQLIDALQPLRSLGARVAVDDAGSGYASLRHILRLRPDIIKLDIDLTRGINIDPARRALASALVGFANEIGASVVAEGIETDLELDTLRQLQVRMGQGYHLARPGPLA